MRLAFLEALNLVRHRVPVHPALFQNSGSVSAIRCPRTDGDSPAVGSRPLCVTVHQAGASSTIKCLEMHS